MKKLLLYILLFISVQVMAQTQKIAILKRAMYNEQKPAKRFAVLMQLLDEHESIYKDSLNRYVTQASVLANMLQDKTAVINAGMARVNMYLRFDRLNDATMLADSLLQITDSNQQDEKALFVKLSLQKINCYAAATKYQAAIDMLYHTLAMAGRLKDTPSQAQCMNALGVISYNMNKLDDQIRWCRRVQALCYGHKQFVAAQAYTNINMAMYFAWTERYDSAAYYVSLAIPLCEKIENLFYLANAYLRRSDIYKWSGDFANAQQSMIKVIEIRRQTEGNLTFSNEQIALANLYRTAEQYDKAIELFNAGINYARDSIRAKGNSINYDILLNYYIGLSRCYQRTGDHELYEATLENIIAVKDTLNALNSEKAIAEMQTKYDVQLKDNTIIRQKLDITQKNIMFYSSLTLLIVSLLIIWLIFRNYNRKQKMKMYLLQEEEKRKAVWAVKEAEEKERKRIAADLHDNMGSYASSIKANVEVLMSQTEAALPVMEHLRSNSQQMVALLGDTIWALKKEELSFSAISDRIKVFLQRLRTSHPQIEFILNENIAYDVKLPPVHAYHLFMMVQEAVNNAVRHSGGNKVAIDIESSGTWLIAISDNGKGLANTAATLEEGNGCYNIRMRAAESGWRVAWEIEPPHGTRVVISNIN